MVDIFKKILTNIFPRYKKIYTALSKFLGNNWLLASSIIFYLILFLAFVVRVINLNYNSAFNDEAIYIVIGRMGLFASDWWSYGAKLWMAGLPYIYPSLSALAYQTGGLVSSRFLNVIFGVILVEEVYRFTSLLNLYDKRTNTAAALIAAFIAAFSGIGIFVSKLATYDMPSFLLLLVGINSFLKAKHFSNGKYYFLTFLCLFLAFLTKIVIAIFLPILFVASILIMRNRPPKHKKLAITYLYMPFAISTALYFYFYGQNLLTYISTHKNMGGSDNYLSIPSLIWSEVKIPLILFLPSAFLIIQSKKLKVLISLTILSAAIPIFHLVFSRFATLDKHLFLTIIFLSVVVGYGASLATFSASKNIGFIAKIVLPVATFLYLVNSYQILNTRQHEWKNTTALQNFLKQNVKLGDKVLTEEGGSVILAVYDKTFPPVNIVTFDWIDYSGLRDERAYVQAVSDAYFDFVELDEESIGNDALKNEIKIKLSANYSPVYYKERFEVYQKNGK